jgi:hypothetical protein
MNITNSQSQQTKESNIFDRCICGFYVRTPFGFDVVGSSGPPIPDHWDRGVVALGLARFVCARAQWRRRRLFSIMEI